MKNFAAVMKGKMQSVGEATKKAGWTKRLFAVCKRKTSPQRLLQEQTERRAKILNPVYAHSSLEKPETYVPTGAPWRQRSPTPQRSQAVEVPNLDNFQGAGIMDHAVRTPAEGDDDVAYIEGDSRVMRLANGNSKFVALLPNSDLAEILQEAVVKHRGLAKVEQSTDSEADRLFQLDRDLERKIAHLEAQIAEGEASAPEDDEEQLARMREEVERARTEQTAARERKTALRSNLKDLRSNLRHEQLDLFGLLDEMLVEGKLLKAEEDDSEDSESTTSTSNELSSDRSSARIGTESTATSLDEHNELPPALRHRAGSSDLRRDSQPDAEIAEEAKRKAAEGMIWNMENKANRLYLAERALDERHHKFDWLNDQRNAKIAAGEEVEPDAEFDLKEFFYTQELTRNVREAEEQFDAAKAEAYAAGVQMPGSEVESGFVDDVNDGYTLSSEEDQIHSVNPQRMERWLDTLPDLSEDTAKDLVSALDFEEFAVTFPVSLESVDLDHWDAESVEVCDSWSLVATGPEKKRINRWKQACGLR